MIREIQVKSVLNKHKKRDTWFHDDYSINPYGSCGFNCLYCYIRGSKYGENLAESLSVKVNAPEILDRQLASRAKKAQYGVVLLASATDPYLPIEKEYGLTRQFLEILLRHRFPVLVITKSDLVVRDTDLLVAIDRAAILPQDLRNKMRGATVSFSMSGADTELSKRLEPGAPDPSKRLETMRILRNEGIKAGVNLMPALPYLTDTEAALESAIKAAREFGAEYVLTGGLTLFGSKPGDSKTMIFRFVEHHYPDLLAKYHELYGRSDFPPRSYTQALERRSEGICRKYQISSRMILT